ncbi:hypothetical protein N7450_009203 [Penicillium hetheringtonii]|uniref:N-acetyltransferase domain-containing protein n=1 Tax=Penicillium hetheringtonii TaxID=911720 RepID=A0AAD6DF86_9EURO|nr:hypothetical protein N7450_009203 [Penicillium hetheringtonii]
MTATIKDPASIECNLEPINLNEKTQFNELQRQRKICGWQYDTQTLQSWKENENPKRLFWITFVDSSNQVSSESTSIRAGHISLDPSSGYLEPCRLRENEVDLSLNTFFILPEYRALRLGKCAVRLLEEFAVTEEYGDLRCRYLTLSALSKRYIYDENWKGMWARIGMPEPSFSIQEWYERLGFVTWKEVPLYEEITLDGETIVLWEALMSKDLRSSS